jgi:hypothetical protein
MLRFLQCSHRISEGKVVPTLPNENRLCEVIFDMHFVWESNAITFQSLKCLAEHLLAGAPKCFFAIPTTPCGYVLLRWCQVYGCLLGGIIFHVANLKNNPSPAKFCTQHFVGATVGVHRPCSLPPAVKNVVYEGMEFFKISDSVPDIAHGRHPSSLCSEAGLCISMMISFSNAQEGLPEDCSSLCAVLRTTVDWPEEFHAIPLAVLKGLLLAMIQENFD